MKLLLSGATNYMVPQKDANKSLGGQMSNTPLPNGRLNVLFTDISKTMSKGDKDTYAVFLYNDEQNEISNLTIQSVYSNIRGKDDNDCIFRFAVTEPSDKGSIEIIGNSKEEPYYVDWFEPVTKREQAFVKFKSMPIPNEELNFLGVKIISTGNKYEDLIKNFEEAFLNHPKFEVFGYSVDTITIKRREIEFNRYEDLSITGSITLLYDITDFKGQDGKTLIDIKIPKGKAIGLWIQREFIPRLKNEDSDCLKMEDEKYSKEENLELNFNWGNKKQIFQNFKKEFE